MDLDVGGPGGPLGGLYVYCEAAGVGVAYFDPNDRRKTIASVLRMAERVMGVPLSLGKVTEHVHENVDLFGDAVQAVKRKRSTRRRTRASDMSEAEGWY